ncbi:hypothetical protein C0993_004598, partial [Termitomyces sp. T159_Od127]
SKLPRRLTLPAERFSKHVALQNPKPHHRKPQEDNDSYFSSVETNNSAGEVIAADDTTEENSVPVTTVPPFDIGVSIQTTKAEKVKGDKEDIKKEVSHITVESPRKEITLKKICREGVSDTGRYLTSPTIMTKTSLNHDL